MKKMRKLLLMGVAVKLASLAAAALLAWYATAEAAEADTNLEDISAPSIEAVAAPSSSPANRRKDRALDEIIVTAQKKAERLQDVPVSVATISGDELEVKAASIFEDVARAIPSVEMVTVQSANTIYIRGMGTDPSSEADASVIMVVDDIALPGRAVGTDIFADVERVEFLRGPQGTLFGKNTVAGAINVTSRKPVHDWEVRGFGGLGNEGRWDGRVIFNAPLWQDKIAVRLNAAKDHLDGYIQNTKNGKLEGGRDRWFLAGKVLVDITDDLELQLKASRSRDEFTNGRQLVGVDPAQAEIIRAIYDSEFESDLNYQMSADGENEGSVESQLYAARLRWNLRSGYSLIAAAAYTEINTFFGFDADQSPIPATNGPTPFDDDATSLELRLESPPQIWDRFSFIAGAYYSESYARLGLDVVVADIDENITALNDGPLLVGVGLPLNGLTEPLGAPEHLIINRRQNIKNQAAYAQGELDLFWDLDAVFGMRYAKTDVYLEQSEITGEVAGQPGVVGPVGIVILQNAGLNPTPLDRRGESREQTAWTGKFALRWRPDEDITVFGNVAQGFKPGLFRVAPKSPDDMGFNSEYSTTYELGAKLSLLDGTGRLNMTLFHTDYQDLQVTIPFQTGKITDNAAEARSRGLELESQWSLPWGFLMGVNLGYLDAIFKSFEAGPCKDGEEAGDSGGCDRSGDRLSYAPEYTAGVDVQAMWPLFDWPIALTAGYDASWQSRVFLAISNEEKDSRGAMWLMNARLGLVDPEGQWSIGMFVSNLTNELYPIQSSVAIFPGSHSQIASPPRTFKLSASVTF